MCADTLNLFFLFHTKESWYFKAESRSTDRYSSDNYQTLLQTCSPVCTRRAQLTSIVVLYPELCNIPCLNDLVVTLLCLVWFLSCRWLSFYSCSSSGSSVKKSVSCWNPCCWLVHKYMGIIKKKKKNRLNTLIWNL